MLFTITDSKSVLMLTKQETGELELKLNVSSYGHEWRSTIGDKLFDFSSGKEGALTILVVTTIQYEFLSMLRQKSGWMACRGLK